MKPDRAPHLLRFLTMEESWDLLQQKVFSEDGSCPEPLEKTGKQIAERCRGLPLAILVISGLLAKTEKTVEWWTRVLNSIGSYLIDDPEQYMSTLELSYNHLPQHLKSCFLYLGAFPEDLEIDVWKLLWLWVAEGFVKPAMENIAEQYLIDLVERSLVIVERKRLDGGIKVCRVHDLLHDLCFKKAKEENFLHQIKPYEEQPSSPNTNGFRATGRRLFIHSHLPDYVFSKPSSSNTRSFILLSNAFYGLENECISFLYCAFKHLRVFEFDTVLTPFLPSEIGQLVHLRYLSLRTEGLVIPKNISSLQNLQTLVIRGGYIPIDFPFCKDSNMPNLMHLWVSPSVRLQHPVALPNIRTISMLHLPVGRQPVLERAPNLRKLGCFVSRQRSGEVQLVESLTPKPQESDVFKLLSSWSDFSQLGRLPNLEILKILLVPFKGQDGTQTMGSSKLKCLKIESPELAEWNTDSDHFPRLERLIMKDCGRLKEIPMCFGDIPTMGLIELKRPRRSAAESARRIFEEQKSLGNDGLKIIIDGLKIIVHGVREYEFELMHKRPMMTFDLRIYPSTDFVADHESLKHLIDSNHPSQICQTPWIHQLHLLFADLTSLRAFLTRSEETRYTVEKVKAMVVRIIDVAIEVEDMVDSFIASFDNDCFLGLENVMQQIQDIKRGVSGFDNHKIQDLVTCWRPKAIRHYLHCWMGGLGKTTLAKRAYYDPYVVYHFYDRVWVTVSQTYQKNDLLLDICSCLSITVTDEASVTTAKLREMIYKRLKDRRYLIVIDDIWDVEAWDDIHICFCNDNIGSRILVTSRLVEVALHIKPDRAPHLLRFLTMEESWDLLQQKVFSENGSCSEPLEETGKQIAERCRGLPLAILVISGLLAKQRKRWNGAFPEDFEIDVRKLLWLWVAEGFIKPATENIAEEYLVDLVERSLVIVERKSQEENFLHQTKPYEEQPSSPNTNGFRATGRRLFYHSHLPDYVFSKPSSSNTRSFLYPSNAQYGLAKECISFLYSAFKHLRVFEFGTISAPFLPSEIGQLVHLRYLSLHTRGLQYAEFDASVGFAIREIATSCGVAEYSNHLMLQLPVGKQPVLERAPNLRKLGCLVSRQNGGFVFFPPLDFLVHLEKLKIWIDINYHPLPNLEILKILCAAFQGPRWDTNDGEFRKLKCLKIQSPELEELNTDSDHFPRLERLIMNDCRRLKEIPMCFGDIPTMGSIELKRPRRSAAESARRIFEEQKSLGNDGLKIIIDGRREDKLDLPYKRPTIMFNYGSTDESSDEEESSDGSAQSLCQRMSDIRVKPINEHGENSDVIDERHEPDLHHHCKTQQQPLNNAHGVRVYEHDRRPHDGEPGIGSRMVGRAQGFYGLCSKEEMSLLMSMSFGFVTGRYNGSTLIVLGRNPVTEKVREMPVVGGSGVFRFARGYVQARTYSFNLKTGDAIVRYDAYVLH
ncbi:hypothetical protein OSB04_022226 [Centaurea solstitialis]|uniref:Dirigent protein n=1 Tax=Centaurea solstitialis TaxID=347529 RepID=A0AA38TFJ5_9ASTR|nr:hypothetical protein OSB04_022226 [Centaurea solstitialis]